MEHRYTGRETVNEHVELWNGIEKYGDFEAENMCSGGIFVKDCQNKIGSTKSVTITFSCNPNLSYKASHDAIVVHKVNNGVGFKWITAHH
ncbi:MAG: hypothetical protein ACI88A_002334 [Paraglaciecola sp.]|jgi:hypothetical protein